MEFGTLIPLYILTWGCILITPIIGFSFLAIIRYSLKDKGLAKNILTTIIITAALAFLYPILDLIRGLILIRFCCTDSSNIINLHTLPEMLSSTFLYALRLIIPGLTIGFILAFFVTVPITLGIRFTRKKNHTPEVSS